MISNLYSDKVNLYSDKQYVKMYSDKICCNKFLNLNQLLLNLNNSVILLKFSSV